MLKLLKLAKMNGAPPEPYPRFSGMHTPHELTILWLNCLNVVGGVGAGEGGGGGI